MTATSMASLAERVARIPKLVLFGAAALVQIALLAVMIVDRAQVLRDGTEVMLQTRPVDPRDFLRVQVEEALGEPANRAVPAL